MAVLPPYGLFTGVNVMTPNFIRYGRAGDNWYELTSGRAIDNEPIWGVTVRPDHTLSQMFFSLADAEKYIATLNDSSQSAS